MNILALLWSKTAGLVVGFVGILVALARVRYSIRKGAQTEMRDEIQQRTLERIETADRIEREHGATGRDDILEQLREQGHLRE